MGLLFVFDQDGQPAIKSAGKLRTACTNSFFQCSKQAWNFISHFFSDDLSINVKVAMHQAVAH
jgi:hypothetical protein